MNSHLKGWKTPRISCSQKPLVRATQLDMFEQQFFYHEGRFYYVRPLQEETQDVSSTQCKAV